jgi:hypothetical protein
MKDAGTYTLTSIDEEDVTPYLKAEYLTQISSEGLMAQGMMQTIVQVTHTPD